MVSKYLEVFVHNDIKFTFESNSVNAVISIYVLEGELWVFEKVFTKGDPKIVSKIWASLKSKKDNLHILIA